MPVRSYALVMGVIFALIGILGFIPAFVSQPPLDAPPLALEAGHGLLFGLFAVNWVHNLIHLASGIWGIAAYRSFSNARVYARVVAVVYGVFIVMGFIPVLWTTFGLAPLHGHDIWLHALIAISAAYFGFGSAHQENRYAVEDQVGRTRSTAAPMAVEPTAGDVRADERQRRTGTRR